MFLWFRLARQCLNWLFLLEPSRGVEGRGHGSSLDAAGTLIIPGRGSAPDSWVAWGQHCQCWEATCNAAAFGQSPNPQLDPVSGNGSAPPQIAVLGNSRAAAQDPSHPMDGTGHSTLVCWEASCNRKPARVALGRTNGLEHTHPYSTFPTGMGSDHT